MEFGLTIATTWLPNEDGGISNDEMLLPQGGTYNDPDDPGAPRALPAGTTDVMSIANALRVPTYLHVSIGGDSCLQLCTWNPGTRTRACTSFTDLQKRHPYRSINTKGSFAGSNVRRITQQLPTRCIDTFDVVVIVCMLNDAWGDLTKAFAEPGRLGAEVAELCAQLGRF